MHRWACPDFSAVKTWGLKLVPEWEPSQNGWFADLPHAQKAYFLPAANSTAIGLRPAILGVSDI
jgi:hypothetical protein